MHVFFCEGGEVDYKRGDGLHDGWGGLHRFAQVSGCDGYIALRRGRYLQVIEVH